MNTDGLKQVAKDIHKGLIFTDRHIPENQREQILPLVFMVIVFMKPEEIDKLAESEPGLIYEYLSEASPRSINGFPSFFSLRLLTGKEAERVFYYIDRLRKAEDVALLPEQLVLVD